MISFFLLLIPLFIKAAPFALVVIPLAGAGMMWMMKKRLRMMQIFFIGCSVIHAVLTAVLSTQFFHGKEIAPRISSWLGPDPVSMVFLGITSFLFLAVAVHTIFWLQEERRAHETAERPDGVLAPHIFFSCLLAFLGAMSLVTLARNFGLLWVAVEATTLVSAPLILFHRSARSLEAMWKYLLICSVGIGLALFGTMLLAVALQAGHAGFSFRTVYSLKESMDPLWFKAAFVFILAGYGTKMGLAPFHTWLPDAHSEAPGAVSALLSGSLLNCSFLAILRFCDAAPEMLKPFCSQLMFALGLLSLLTAACFIIRQTDFKRMLAYSSVEHMGLLVIFLAANGMDVMENGLKLGMIHLAGHSLTKMSLFLLAGNILLAYGTRQIPKIGGLFGRIPRNSLLWLIAVLMICGMPPGPLFYTEFGLLFLLPPWMAAVVLILLFMIFAGMTHAALCMVMGHDGEVPPDPPLSAASEKLILMPMIAIALLLTGGSVLLIQLIGRSVLR